MSSHLVWLMTHRQERGLLLCMLPLVVDILIWLHGVSLLLFSLFRWGTHRVLVVDDCGAMPDLEDREGEVSDIVLCTLSLSHLDVRRPSIKLHCMATYP